MGILRRATRPVRAPARRVLRVYSRVFEELVHTVKSDLVGRFDVSERRLEGLERTISTGQENLADQLALQSAAVRNLQAEVVHTSQLVDQLAADQAEAMQTLAKELAERVAAMAPAVRLRELTGSRLGDLDGLAAAFLNWVQAHNGPLAEAGLWLNPATVLEWETGSVKLNAVNERIVEQPFVFAALGDLRPGARILDIGGGESTVSLSLASLGFQVTVIEPQGYPFVHPNLTVVDTPLEDFVADEPFDAVVLLSAIEHFGIGHYANGPEPRPDADVEALLTVGGLIAPDGRLVLTTPYGPASVNDLERTYDRAGIDRLLEGWDIRYAAVARRSDRRTWEMEAFELIDPPGEGRVVMLAATRSSTA